MNIKAAFLLLLSVCCAGTNMANPISESQAKTAALNFLNSNPATRFRGSQTAQLRLAYIEPTLSTPAYYIYIIMVKTTAMCW